MTAALILLVVFGLSVLVIITCEDNGSDDEPEATFWPEPKPFVIPPDGPYTVTAFMNGKNVEVGPFLPGDRVGLKAMSDGSFGVVKLGEDT